MRICGIDFQGSVLVPVLLESRDNGWAVLVTSPKKIDIADIFDTEEVRLFAKEVAAFLIDTSTDRVVIRKRARSGKFAGGAASFRMGGVVQLATEKPVEFISAQAISATLRDDDHAEPDSLLEYQRDAYRTALAYAMGL